MQSYGLTISTRGYCYECEFTEMRQCECGSICNVTSKWEGGVEISRRCACECTVSLASGEKASCETR